MIRRFIVLVAAMMAAVLGAASLMVEQTPGAKPESSLPMAFCVRYSYFESDKFRFLTLFGVSRDRKKEHKYSVFVDNKDFIKNLARFEEGVRGESGEIGGDYSSTYLSSRFFGEDKATLADLNAPNGRDGSVSHIVSVISLYESTE